MLNEQFQKLMSEIDDKAQLIVEGVERNFKGQSFYSSMDMHRQFMKKAKTIQAIIDI